MLVLASARTPRSPAPHHNPTACKVSRQSLDELRLTRGRIVSANKFVDRLARVRLALTGFQCGPLEGLVIHSEDRTGVVHTPEACLRFYRRRQSLGRPESKARVGPGQELCFVRTPRNRPPA